MLITFCRASRHPADEPLRSLSRLLHALSVLGFFHVTCIGWLIFRAGSISTEFSQAAFVHDSLGSLVAPIQFGEVVPVLRVLLIVGALAMAVQWKNEALERFGLWAPARQAAAAALIVMAIVTLGVFDGADFIYFQF